MLVLALCLVFSILVILMIRRREHFGHDVFCLHQVYEDYAEQADNWLSSKEAFLANDDLGVS